jgi:hypothetical protein
MFGQWARVGLFNNQVHCIHGIVTVKPKVGLSVRMTLHQHSALTSLVDEWLM